MQFDEVTYRIGRQLILDAVSLAVLPGEVVVLLGRSGSGKTTLLRTVNGLVQPTGGAVSFAGRPVREWGPVPLRRRIGYVIQEAGLLPHLSVAENITLAARLEGWDETARRERAAALLDLVELPREYGQRLPHELSGGQRQRVGIARALALEPPLLLLDEPFAALDPLTRLDLQRELRGLLQASGKTALFVTHDIREALLLATRIVLLQDGHVDTITTPREFAAVTTPEALAFRNSLDETRGWDEPATRA